MNDIIPCRWVISKAHTLRKCSLTFLESHYNLGAGRGLLFRRMPYFPRNHGIIIIAFRICSNMGGPRDCHTE